MRTRIFLKRYGDLIVTSVIVLTSLILLLLTDMLIRTSTSRIAADHLGTTFWPKLILAGIVILGTVALIQIVRRLRHSTWDEEEEKEELARYTDIRLISLMVVTVVYALLLPILGFTIITPVYLIVFCWLIGITKLFHNIGYSVVLTGALIYIFGNFLYVPLPRGVGILREISYYLY